MNKALELDLTPLLAVLKKDGGYMASRELAAMLGIDARYIGFNLTRAAGKRLVDLVPKTNNSPARYRYREPDATPQAGRNWREGWRNPATGVAAPRLG